MPPGCSRRRRGRSSWPATASSGRGRRRPLRELAKGLHIPVAVTFMGKGAIDDRSHLSLMAVGLQARDHVLSGFDRADLVVCDRLRPGRVRAGALEPGRPQADRPHRHPAGRGGRLRTSPRSSWSATSTARSGGCSRPSCRTASAGAMRASATRRARRSSTRTCAPRCSADLGAFDHDDGWPIKPQKALADLRRALGPEDIVVSDVGAHKIWVARLYQAYEPNTVIISNGFAAMGISLPGAIAAKLVHPDRRVVALCGDGGFLMNSQELETARRIGANITVVVWRDDGYGLIDWKQRSEFGRPFGVDFRQPGLRGLRGSRSGSPAFRPATAADLYPTPDARARARRADARRRPDRLPREPAPDRAARRARPGPLGGAGPTLAPAGRGRIQPAGAFGFFGFGGRFGVLSPMTAPHVDDGSGRPGHAAASGHDSRRPRQVSCPGALFACAVRRAVRPRGRTTRRAATSSAGSVASKRARGASTPSAAQRADLRRDLVRRAAHRVDAAGRGAGLGADPGREPRHRPPGRLGRGRMTATRSA